MSGNQLPSFELFDNDMFHAMEKDIGDDGNLSSQGYMFRTVGVKDDPYVFKLELVHNGNPVVKYHTLSDLEIETGNEHEVITCTSTNPVSQDRLIVVLGKTSSSPNSQPYIYDAWLLDNSSGNNSLSNNSSLSTEATSGKYCYYVNDGSTVQPDYHFEFHYYDTTDGNLVEIPMSQLSEKDKEAFSHIIDLFYAYEPVLQASVEYDEVHMEEGDIKSFEVYRDYTKDIKTVMSGGQVDEDYYSSHFLFSDIYPFLPQQQRGEEDFLVHSDEQRRQVLKTPGPIIDFSDNNNIVFNYPELQKQVMIDSDRNVTVDGTVDSTMLPIDSMMQIVIDMVQDLPVPEGDSTIKRYASKGITLSPNTSLENLYVLQQAINNYENKLYPAATSAILARFRIFKRSDQLLSTPYLQLLQQAGIQPTPNLSLIDAYLEIGDMFKTY